MTSTFWELLDLQKANVSCIVPKRGSFQCAKT